MLLAPTIICFLVYQANEKIQTASITTKANVILQWSIILIIFIPICVGFFLFGKYAATNEYAHLPSSSEEIHN
jgi:uncharacterized membrane protein YoaK (UPF0700 family)